MQRRETARRHYRLRYLLRALQLHRPRGPLNPADVIDLISPFREPATGSGRDDNAPVIDLTELIALSMQEPDKRCQQHTKKKKPGDTRSTALELDLSTPSVAGSRTSAVASVRAHSTRSNRKDDGYESDEEEGDGNDEQSILTQPPRYTGERIGQRSGAAEKNTTGSATAGNMAASNTDSQSSRSASRAFAIRHFSPAMVQCIVNGRAQRGPWPSLLSLLDAVSS